jgi:CHAD domain-containing protein
MLHSLRIECKRLRYLLEFFTNLFPGDEINRLIKQLKKLQDNLGLFQDFSVQEETLMGFVEKFNLENPENRQTILAIGALVGSLDSEKQAVRRAFANTFANFTSAENNLLFTELFSGGKGVGKK